jgi:hypothetical protein
MDPLNESGLNYRLFLAFERLPRLFHLEVKKSSSKPPARRIRQPLTHSLSMTRHMRSCTLG